MASGSLLLTSPPTHTHILMASGSLLLTPAPPTPTHTQTHTLMASGSLLLMKASAPSVPSASALLPSDVLITVTWQPCMRGVGVGGANIK